MEELIPLLAILMVFGIPGYLIKRTLELRHERKMRELEANTGGAGAAELEGLRDERKLLLGRIENLETIVCSVDYELNEKLNRLVISGVAPAALLIEGGVGADEPAGELAAGEDAGTAGTAIDPEAAARKKRPEPPRRELDIGSVLNERYRIQRLLGRGGMGAVYLADDWALGEPVALKVVSSLLALDPEQASERFRREAQAARRIAHPNVIRIHDLGSADSLLYISMEYFPGKTLGDLLSARGTLGADEYRDVLGQICDGLAAAHSAGVVHRDLKPGNVLVGERNAVKLIDFGLATSELMKGLTATGQMLGTPNYMSPEQVRGRPVDARSDIYSLGALAYHLVTGQPPFDGASPIAVGFAHLMEPPIAPRERRPEVDAALSDMIVRALAKEPADRPQTIAELRAAL